MKAIHLLPIVFIASCVSQPAAPPLPIELAFQNLAAWSGLQKIENRSLAEDIARARKADDSAHCVLVQAPRSSDQILITDVGWTVAVCMLSPDLEIKEVLHFPAKCGFTLTRYQGLVVILHKHPGTDMFYDVPLRFSVRPGKIIAKEVSNQERNEIMRHINHKDYREATRKPVSPDMLELKK